MNEFDPPHSHRGFTIETVWLNDTFFSQEFYSLQNSGPCNSVNYLGHSKMSVDDDNDDDDDFTVSNNLTDWQNSA